MQVAGCRLQVAGCRVVVARPPATRGLSPPWPPLGCPHLGPFGIPGYLHLTADIGCLEEPVS